MEGSHLLLLHPLLLNIEELALEKHEDHEWWADASWYFHLGHMAALHMTDTA